MRVVHCIYFIFLLERTFYGGGGHPLSAGAVGPSMLCTYTPHAHAHTHPSLSSTPARTARTPMYLRAYRLAVVARRTARRLHCRFVRGVAPTPSRRLVHYVYSLIKDRDFGANNSVRVSTVWRRTEASIFFVVVHPPHPHTLGLISKAPLYKRQSAHR